MKKSAMLNQRFSISKLTLRLFYPKLAAKDDDDHAFHERPPSCDRHLPLVRDIQEIFAI